MASEKEKKGVFQIHCPDCHSTLSVDPLTKAVIRSERVRKKKGSLDEMLLKEKKRMAEFDRKFEATAEMQKVRWKQAQEKFKKALENADKEEE